MAFAIAIAFALTARAAHAETRVYSLAIGNNAVPADMDPSGERLPTLHYADDDAAAFFSFLSPVVRHGELLTVFDATSQRRFPELTSAARLPSLAELRRVVARYKATFEEDRRAGHEPVLLLFYSGHGSRGTDKPPALAMLDGALTQTILYDEILAVLPAHHIHLIIDACHAESVVRPRDGQASTFDISAKALASFANNTTLARFPNVGALVAATNDARTFEWNALERGVFTHAVLSGLRGGADVNGDRRIEYSELYAFLVAANREVADPRARIAVVVRPPSSDPHAPIVDLSTPHSGASMRGVPQRWGHFFVEDDKGNRLLDLNAESGFRIALEIPPGRVFVRVGDREAEALMRDGDKIDIGSLALADARATARGSIEHAIEHGLFAAPFGPAYYRALIDGHEELLPVAPDRRVAREEAAEPGSGPRTPGRTAAWVSLSSAAVLGGATAAFVGLTLSAKNDYDETSFERDAADARSRFTTFRTMAVVGGVATGVTLGVGLWLLLHGSEPTSHARAPLSPLRGLTF